MKQLAHVFFVLVASTGLLCPGAPFAAREATPTFGSYLARFQKSAGKVGIEVISLSSGRPVWECRSKDTFVPASLVKVFTSYAALKHLGPRHHFTTCVWTTEEPHGESLNGSIWIKSDGDMFLLAEKASALAVSLRELGIRHIRGGVYVDNSFFEPGTERICLDGDCASSYNPVLSATSMDFNTISFHVAPAAKAGKPVGVDWGLSGDYVRLINLASTTPKNSKPLLKLQSLGTTPDNRQKFQISGKLPAGTATNCEYRTNVDNPAAFVAHSFKVLLHRAGIEVHGQQAQGGRVPDGAKRIATYESPPLAELLYGLNRYSNNFMAEMLLRSLGAQVFKPPGTREKGVAVVQKTLRERGIPEQEASLDGGSGLSRNCWASPDAFCRVLVDAYKDATLSTDFLSSLAVNGQEGTLRRRMRSSGVAVKGKTGTLNNVVSFAGYVFGTGEDSYVVAVLLNDVQNFWEARETLDSFLENLPTLAASDAR